MKKLLALALGAALLTVSGAARAADDPFAGWTEAQMKAKIKMLMQENAELKAKPAAASSTAPAKAEAPAPVTTTAAPAAKKAPKPLVLDDFEGDMAKNGVAWYSGCDKGGLGSTISPDPFVAAKGGSKDSPGHCGHVKGHLGTSKDPWPWATLSLKATDPDISAYSAISFWVKGDGKTYHLLMGRTAVKDYAHYYAEFTAPKDWTKVTLPLASFTQPATWGEKVPMAWNDLEKYDFMPVTNDEDFEFSIDDVTLLP